MQPQKPNDRMSARNQRKSMRWKRIRKRECHRVKDLQCYINECAPFAMDKKDVIISFSDSFFFLFFFFCMYLMLLLYIIGAHLLFLRCFICIYICIFAWSWPAAISSPKFKPSINCMLRSCLFLFDSFIPIEIMFVL